ncbi:MAG: hypothetical protein HQL32_15205 [Planctomycetes bacterium]|nr:hypothetical protein [Planctomycetota bacterium]
MDIIKKINLSNSISATALAIAIYFSCLCLNTLWQGSEIISYNEQLKTELAEDKTAIDPNVIKERIAEKKKKSSDLKRHNYIFPIIPRPPVLTSVMGDEALINDRWLKVGASIEGEKILNINEFYVELEKEGKKRKLYISGFSR